METISGQLTAEQNPSDGWRFSSPELCVCRKVSMVDRRYYKGSRPHRARCSGPDLHQSVGESKISTGLWAPCGKELAVICLISQWSERRQRLLQSQREKLGVHTIVFPGYSLSVWECACPVRVCVGLHLTGSPITKHCALALVFLSMVHWTKGHGKWRPKEERWWLDRTEVTVCVLLFLKVHLLR